jgi:hypothetical protein
MSKKWMNLYVGKCSDFLSRAKYQEPRSKNQERFLLLINSWFLVLGSWFLVLFIKFA